MDLLCTRNIFFIFFTFFCVTKAQDQIEGSGEGSGEEIAHLIAECEPKLDIILLFDTSGSIRPVYSDNIYWASNLVGILPIGRDKIRVSAIQYAGFPLTEFALNTYTTKEDVQYHLNQMKFRSGVTRTGAGLRRAKVELFRTGRGGRLGVRKLILLFTDGLSIDNPNKVAEELRVSDGVQIYAVSVATDGFTQELMAVTGSETRIFLKGDFLKLKSALLNDVFQARRSCSRQKPSVSSKKQEPVLQPVDEEFAELQKATSTKSPTTSLIQETSTDSQPSTRAPSPHPGLLPEQTYYVGTKELPKFPVVQLKQSLPGTQQRLHCILANSDGAFYHASGKECLDAQSAHLGREEELPVPKKKQTASENAHGEPVPAEMLVGAAEIENSGFAKDEHSTTHLKDDELLLVPSGKFKNTSDCPVDVLVLVDSSGSIRKKFLKQKQFVRSLIDTVMNGRSENRIALVQFAGNNVQHIEFSFESYRSTIGMRRAVDRLQHYTGTTYIGAAFIQSRNILNERRRNVPTLVILVSDGYSQDDALTAALGIRRLAGVQLYAVALANKNDRRFLGEITGSPNRVFVGDDEASVFLHILKELGRCVQRKRRK